MWMGMRSHRLRLLLILIAAALASSGSSPDGEFVHWKVIDDSPDPALANFRSAVGLAVASSDDGCDNDEQMTINLTVCIFGELEDDVTKRKSAEQWLFVTVLDSMTHPMKLEASCVATKTEGEQSDCKESKEVIAKRTPLDVDPLTEVDPYSEIWSLPAFTEDETGSISPTQRTYFRVSFKVQQCHAEPYIERICADYTSADQVLLTAILRSLDNAQLYPHEGLEIAAAYGGLNAALNARVEMFDSKGDVQKNVGCGRVIIPGSAQSSLFFPSCPEHSDTCANLDGICDEEEAKRKPWQCKCEMAYEGDLKIDSITEKEDGTLEFKRGGKLKYSGTCTKKSGYCNAAEPYGEDYDGKNMISTKTGQPALGVIGEDATATCPEGTRDTGSSQCVADTKEAGKWEPERKCKYIPPMSPPPPAACPALDTASFLVPDSCSMCRPKDPDNPQEFKECKCSPTCREGFRHTAGPTEGTSLQCDTKKYECPPAEELRWDMQNKTCHAASGSTTYNYCCKEAWGGLLPKELVSKSCAEQKTEVDCLTGRDSSSNMPCCYRDKGFKDERTCTAKGSEAIAAGHAPDACAIGPDLYYGMWHELPICTKMCTNSMSGIDGVEQVETCEQKVASETCKVQCAPGFDNYGLTTLLGERECSADTLSIGEPPICLPAPAAPTCDESQLHSPHHDVKGKCARCKAGSQDCDDCKVQCTSGTKAVQGSEGVKKCLLIDNPELKETTDCAALAATNECLLSFKVASPGKVPCCWTKGTDDSPGACMEKNSEGITSNVICSTMTAATFEPLPTCEAKCPNQFAMLSGIVMDEAARDACASCVPSEGEACPCEVKCETALVRYGGGEEGKKACLPSPEPEGVPALEAGPVCDMPEPTPFCGAPDAPSAAISASCQGCLAGTDCPGCKVECPAGTRKVGGGDEGSKTCQIEDSVLKSDAVCSTIDNLKACMESKDKESGQPCCFNEEGLSSDGSKCLAMLDVTMVKQPQRLAVGSSHPACAPLKKGAWKEEMPVCEAIVRNSWTSVANVVYDEEKCSKCVASDAASCECEVKCASGFERYGGGPEGKATISLVDGVPTFGDAPLCLGPEASPRCTAPVVGEATVVSKACSSCTAAGVADHEDCDCFVECSDGHAPFGEVGSYQPEKKCTEVPNNAVVSQSCEGLDSAACLTSAEDGIPCGWSQEGLCLKKGSEQFKSSDRKAQFTKMRGFSWDKMPECKLLCINTFSSTVLEVVGDCNTCFAGAANKADCESKCKVECAAGTKLVEGSGAEGPKSCDEQGHFEEAPNCIPVHPTVENPKCASPSNPGKLLNIEGCRGCTAGEKDCDCNVKCSENLLPVTPELEGPKECELSYYKCPKFVEFDKESSYCKDPVTGRFTRYLCCTEAWFTKPPSLQEADCTAITDETHCLGSKDTSGKACCWFGDGETSAGSDPKVCVPKESDFIDDEHLPQECADRRAVKTYEWQKMPECAPICKQEFTSMPTLEAKDCERCHGHDKNDCSCTVECAAGLVHFGRGAVGPRKCDPRTASFGAAPLCLTPPTLPQCLLYELAREDIRPVDCRGCTAGATTDECLCNVYCTATFVHVEGSPPEGPLSCHSKEKTLTAGTCEGADWSTCMNTEEDGTACCWIDMGCHKKGSEEIVTRPDECADEPLAEWDEAPKCEKTCSSQQLSRVAEELGFELRNCDGCRAGDSDCKCEVACSPTTPIRVGGGEEGFRSCTLDDVEFQDAPICMHKEAVDPPPICYIYPVGNYAEQHDCWECEANAGDHYCTCEAYCIYDHLPIKGSTEGLKECIAVEHQLLDVSSRGGCASLSSEGDCLTSEQAGVSCCWMENEGTCGAQGTRDILNVPNKCAPKTVGKWKDADNPLVCSERCSHSFPSEEGYVYDVAACTSCTGGGSECGCSIHCDAEKGYERAGGAPEGARACTESEPSFEAAPLCMKKPEAPTCPELQDAKYQVTGCSHCKAGDESCSCDVDCAPGYKQKKAKDNPRCASVKAEDHSGGYKCEELYADDCKQSMEDGQPCCYRRWELNMFLRCLPKGDPRLETEPDVCAPTEVAQWEGLPECAPKCANIFDGAANVEHKDCDDCILGEPCDCTVSCKDGTFPLTSGTEGSKACVWNSDSGSAEFQAPPVCMKKCEAPDDDQGTLDVSDCQEPCFPGQPCDCKVRCAKNNHRTGGGSEGTSLRCKEENGFTYFQGLPICLPQCTEPDNQERTLNTKRCRSSCDAGWECKECNLQCYGKRKGGGPEGKRACIFFPGTAERPAVGRWVNIDDRKCYDVRIMSPKDIPSYCQELPMCMSPFLVHVVDARTKKSLHGAMVTLKDPQGVLEPMTTVSDKDGRVELQTTLVDLVISVSLDGYAEMHRGFDRVSMCSKATDCGMTMPLSPELESGEVGPDCTVLLEHGKNNDQQKWTMQATLTWAETPEDLDIWVRNFRCATQINERYECTKKTDTTLRYTCAVNRETMVKASGKQQAEAYACAKYWCPRATGSTASLVDIVDGQVSIENTCMRYLLENQYHKWVMHDSRVVYGMEYMLDDIIEEPDPEKAKHMHYPPMIYDPIYRHIPEVMPRGPKEAGGVYEAGEGWNEDNWLLLDTDERYGWGPETVTFHNVPPGMYQIFVDIYKLNGEEPDIRKAKPRVDISIGKAGVKVVCEPSPWCKRKATSWQVADVYVEYDGRYELDPNKYKYKIRVEDEKLENVYRFEQPARGADRSSSSRSRKNLLSYEFGHYYYTYWQNNGNGYYDSHLQKVCKGKCRMEEGFEDYGRCLRSDVDP